MRVRTFISYLWLFLMALFVGFGSYYIATGNNLLTGQNRSVSSPAVLDAFDTSETEENVSEASNQDVSKEEPDVRSEENQKMALFVEVMSEITENTTVELAPLSGGEAAVFAGFGEENSQSYIAGWASGLITEGQYFIWLVNEEESLMIGELELLDNTDVYKVALKSPEDISVYNQIVLTLEDLDVEVEEYNDENVVYSADIINLVGSDSEGTSESNSDSEGVNTEENINSGEDGNIEDAVE